MHNFLHKDTKHLCLSFFNAVTLAENVYVHVIIGVSLSKPHTSGIALQDVYVCQFVCCLIIDRIGLAHVQLHLYRYENIL